MEVTQFSREQMQAAVHLALRAWHSSTNTPENLLEQLVLVQERREEKESPTSPTALRQITNEILLEGINELELIDQPAARVLRLRFQDGNTIVMVGFKLNVSGDTVSRLQRAAITGLAEIIYHRELDAREARSQAMEAQFPPASYTQLFGYDDAQAQLLGRLLEPDNSWVVTILGIGGIGKTALADAVARKVIRTFQFDRVIWLRAQPQSMSGHSPSPQLTFDDLTASLAGHLGFDLAAASSEQRLVSVRRKLKDRPYLIVIDNLETDAETVYLLDRLTDLARPSKFLLTSRMRPPKQATLFQFSLTELSQADALALMRHHAASIGLTALDTAGESDMVAVYRVTGGNPLALKLVVSLLDVLSLPQIMEDLMRSQPGPIEDLYRHIYWQTWRILSDNARTLLQAMPLVAETGGLPDYLQTISGQSADQFWPALQELIGRSLLEVRGTIQQKRYGVHRLTETFLRTEIIRWPTEGVEDTD